MLQPHEEPARVWLGRPDRREILVVGAAGLINLSLAHLLHTAGIRAAEPAPANASPAPSQAARTGLPARARAVILVWLSGGPSHMDTFDPKPGIGVAYNGKFARDLPTNVTGVRLAMTLPRLAQQADKYALLRGMTHSDNNHESASYKGLTGTPGRGDLSYPLVGAVVAQKQYERGYGGALPPFVILGNPFTRVGGAGFLGQRCEAFVNSGAANTPAGAAQRAEERRSLLQSLDTLGGQAGEDAAFRAIDASRNAAYGLLLGRERRVFDLSEETAQVRERYGSTALGQRCLLARRLIEHGVPFIAVNYGGWDTHARHFERMERELCPALDQALSGLLADLHDRGLLGTTAVVCLGEFGRTPEVYNDAPWFGGRHHYGRAFSALVAGGGFRGGQVVGATDRLAATVTTRPIYPWDLWGSVYRLMGIDPHGLLPHPEGRMVRVSPAAGADVSSGGLLTEIM